MMNLLVSFDKAAGNKLAKLPLKFSWIDVVYALIDYSC
jgi:hypothetical protein